MIDASNIDTSIKDCISHVNSNTYSGRTYTELRVNPNKLGDIFTFWEFKQRMEMIAKGAGIEHYQIVRADLRFDSYKHEHFEAYLKLHRLLISALAITYKVKNVYTTADLFTWKPLNVAIKNDYFQIENYDRERKSQNTENHLEPAKSRLEERSVGRQFRECVYTTGNLDPMEALRMEFAQNWVARWDQAIANIDLVYERSNIELAKIWRDGKNKKPVPFPNLTAFLCMYENGIYNRKQLVDLLERIGVSNPKIIARNHKARYAPEFFSKGDILRAVNEVKRATAAFFEAEEPVQPVPEMEKNSNLIPFLGEWLYDDAS